MLARDRHHVLTNQEDVKGVRKEGWHEQGKPGVHPTEVEEEHVGGDQRYGTGNEDRGDHDLKELAATREA